MSNIRREKLENVGIGAGFSWLILEAWNPIYRTWFAGGKLGNVVSLLLISEGGSWSWGTRCQRPLPG